jgi:hypothetical protein
MRSLKPLFFVVAMTSLGSVFVTEFTCDRA